MIRKSSKKYFRETVLAVLPKVYYSRNPKLIDDAISILTCYIPKKSSLPLKLESSLAKYDLQKVTYQELVEFLRDKDHLTQDGIKFVKFLEQEILRYAVQEYKTDELYNKTEENLSDLRSSSPKGVKNTCCYSCGKVLERHDADPEVFQKNPHFCTKRENQTCFMERGKQERKEDKEWQFILRGQQCTKCKVSITFSLDPAKNHIYKGQVFCSNRCWEAYRKSFQRQNKPVPGNLDSIPGTRLI